jgi:hypothetical protein
MCSLFLPRNNLEFLGRNREHIGTKEPVHRGGRESGAASAAVGGQYRRKAHRSS